MAKILSNEALQIIANVLQECPFKYAAPIANELAKCKDYVEPKEEK